MATYEVEATITYHALVDVEADNAEDAKDRFNQGKFSEVYLDSAEMVDWDARHEPTEAAS